jgi:hypothetical protein
MTAAIAADRKVVKASPPARQEQDNKKEMSRQPAILVGNLLLNLGHRCGIGMPPATPSNLASFLASAAEQRSGHAPANDWATGFIRRMDMAP